MKRAAESAGVLAVVLIVAANAALSCSGGGASKTPVKTPERVTASSTQTTGAPPTASVTQPADSMPTMNAAPTAGSPSVSLPAPRTQGPVSLEEAIAARRSVRDFTDDPLSLSDLGQLLWAAQGITSETGARAAPSAGGTYPLEIYVATGRVSGLEPGIYRYRPQDHSLESVSQGDLRAEIMAAGLDQASIGQAAVDVVIGAVYERTAQRYGERAERYAHLEAGHAAQNLCLQAVALGLGAVTIGAFDDEEVRGVVGMAEGEEPLYIIPVGVPE